MCLILQPALLEARPAGLCVQHTPSKQWLLYQNSHWYLEITQAALPALVFPLLLQDGGAAQR